MVVQKLLQSDALDDMVLRVLAQWEHAPWFWKNARAGQLSDDILKSTMTRAIQMERARHREEPILNWMAPQDPRILFVAAMVYCISTPQTIQTKGLYSSLAQNWEPIAVNQAFTWMRGHDCDDWIRCQKAIKKEGGVLVKTPFSLMDHLSKGIQERFAFCSSLDIVPSAALLRSPDTNIKDTVANIGLFL